MNLNCLFRVDLSNVYIADSYSIHISVSAYIVIGEATDLPSVRQEIQFLPHESIIFAWVPNLIFVIFDLFARLLVEIRLLVDGEATIITPLIIASSFVVMQLNLVYHIFVHNSRI